MHRYREFFDLFSTFKNIFLNIPKFPSKSIGKVTNFTELNKRRDELNEFIGVRKFLN
jgi:hypothetical protein